LRRDLNPVNLRQILSGSDDHLAFHCLGYRFSGTSADRRKRDDLPEVTASSQQSSVLSFVRADIEDAVNFRMLKDTDQVSSERAVGRLRGCGVRMSAIPHKVESEATENLAQRSRETSRQDARLSRLSA
jgi:hypothetical protein